MNRKAFGASFLYWADFTDIRNSRFYLTVYRWDIFCPKISAKIWSWERRSKISIALKLSLVLDGAAALALLLLLRTKARWRGVRLPMMIISGIFMQHRLGFGPAKGPVSCCLKSPFKIWISSCAKHTQNKHYTWTEFSTGWWRRTCAGVVVANQS